MRLGLYEAALEPGSIVAELYGADKVSERHRHRYEVNNHYRDRIAEAGHGLLGRLARPRRSSSTSSCRARCTRSTWARRRTPSCGRGRTARTRCSAGWSPPRSSASRQSRLFEVAEPGERPVELHDAVGVATPLPRGRRRSGHPARRGLSERAAARLARPGEDPRCRDRLRGHGLGRQARDRRVRRTARSRASTSTTPARSRCSRSTTRSACC